MKNITEIAISKITLTGWNPRKSFESEAFEELKKSIQEHGILEPLIVRPEDGVLAVGTPSEEYIEEYFKKGHKFQLVAGERRFKAAQELGLENVPVVIKNLTDRDVREIMLIENLQRSGLEPLDEAAALHVLLEDTIHSISQEELAKKLGKSQPWIANRLRLLKAPDELRGLLISREMSPKHVMALLPVIEYPVYKESILPVVKREIKIGEISVKRLEGLIEQCIINDHSGDFVFRLDELGWQYREFKKYLDMPGCAKDCPHVRFYNRYGGTVRYCLNRKCWSDKINVAKQKAEKANAAHVKKLGDKKTVDTIKLGYGKYGYLHPSNFDNGFDEAECVACESCKKDKRDLKQLICIDVACYKKKKRTHADQGEQQEGLPRD